MPWLIVVVPAPSGVKQRRHPLLGENWSFLDRSIFNGLGFARQTLEGVSVRPSCGHLTLAFVLSLLFVYVLKFLKLYLFDLLSYLN